MVRNKIGWFQLVISALGYLLGVASNAIANFIVGIQAWGLVITIGLLVSCLMIYALIMFFKKSVTTVKDYKQYAIRGPDERRQNARSGLIAIVPWYLPPKIPDQNPDEGKLYAEVIKKSAADGKYDLMDFENSNFGHVVEAITTHSSKLHDCWLLSTTNIDTHMPGSKLFVPALINYLKNEKKLECQFHWEEISVVLDDDSAITERTKDIVMDIFNQTPNTKDLIADFTGGPRSMALGIFLACLDSQRDLQFIGTHYNDSGQTTGTPYPLVTHFSVQVDEK